MRNKFKTLLLLLFILFASCKTSEKEYTKNRLPQFFGNELDFLSSYRSTSDKDNNKSIVSYESLNLRTVNDNDNYEFWIRDSLVYSMPKKIKDKCRVIEVFKKNFILISNGSCGIATPDYVDRNNVIIIDLNSHHLYTFSLGDLFLTRSIEMANSGYPNSNNYFGILNIDLDSKKIKINNQLKGTLEFDLSKG